MGIYGPTGSSRSSGSSGRSRSSIFGPSGSSSGSGKSQETLEKERQKALLRKYAPPNEYVQALEAASDAGKSGSVFLPEAAQSRFSREVRGGLGFVAGIPKGIDTILRSLIPIGKPRKDEPSAGEIGKSVLNSFKETALTVPFLAPIVGQVVSELLPGEQGHERIGQRAEGRSYTEVILEDLGNIAGVFGGVSAGAGLTAKIGGTASKFGSAAAKVSAATRPFASPGHSLLRAAGKSARGTSAAAREGAELGRFGKAAARVGERLEAFDFKRRGKEKFLRDPDAAARAMLSHDYTRSITTAINELSPVLRKKKHKDVLDSVRDEHLRKAEGRPITDDEFANLRERLVKAESRAIGARLAGSYEGPTPMEAIADTLGLADSTVTEALARANKEYGNFIDRFPHILDPTDLNVLRDPKAFAAQNRAVKTFQEARRDEMLAERFERLDAETSIPEGGDFAAEAAVEGARLRGQPGPRGGPERIPLPTMGQVGRDVRAAQTGGFKRGVAKERKRNYAAEAKAARRSAEQKKAKAAAQYLEAFDLDHQAVRKAVDPVQVNMVDGFFRGKRKIIEDIASGQLSLEDGLLALAETSKIVAEQMEMSARLGNPLRGFLDEDVVGRGAAFARQRGLQQLDDLIVEQGHVRWDPAVHPAPDSNGFVLLEGRKQKVVTHSGTGDQYIVPQSLASARDAIVNPTVRASGEGAVVRNLARVTDPWRYAVLNLSPRWNVNNAIGNAVLTSLEVGPVAAFGEAARIMWEGRGARSKRAFTKGHLTAERRTVGVPEELQASGISLETGQGKAKIFRGKHNPLQRFGAASERMNNTVDGLARAVVFKKTVKKNVKGVFEDLDGENVALNADTIFAKIEAGGELTPGELQVVEQAMDRARHALVDYSNLTPNERNVVRRIIPFYAWQKGIVKLAFSLPEDHPLRFAVLTQIANTVDFMAAERELFPDYLLPQVSVGGATFSTRGAFPLTDVPNILDYRQSANLLGPIPEAALRLVAQKADFASPFVGPVDINAIGYPEARVSPGDLLSNTFRDLPPLQVLREYLSGRSDLARTILGPQRDSMTPGRATLGILGIPYRPNEQLFAGAERQQSGRAEYQRREQAEREQAIRQRLGLKSITRPSKTTSPLITQFGP